LKAAVLYATHDVRFESRDGDAMPHVVVKLYPGRSDEQKARLAERIAADIIDTLRSDEKSISVAFEDVRPEDWLEQVYKPDIAARWEQLFKKPGYDPLE
jgi:4-oxalocrotonate tautomerase